jgi:hypothetical protein
MVASAAALTEVRQVAAELCIAYYHWRDEGFPANHRYHLVVALFEAKLQALVET